jgi:tetratricopeptide (TPR) repeat protein
MHTLISFLCSALVAVAQQPAPKAYIPFDAQSILIKPDNEKGQGPAVNITKLDAWIDELAEHAKNYPPKFASEADKQIAIKDAKLLMGLLDTLNEPGKPNVELLRRAGFVNSLAHNLDVPGAAQKAVEYFSKLLEFAPNDPQGNYMFGAFLGGVGKADAALPFLLKADSLGVQSAPYALGVSFLVRGEKQKSIECFERYKKLVPDDTSIDPLIAAIRSGKFEVKYTPGKQ